MTNAALIRWTPPLIDRKRPISGQVRQALHHAIIRGHLPPRTRLSENELSEIMGVSRTPVRESLIKLSEEGLVNVYPQYGSFVAPIRLSEVYEARFIREALECAVVAEAARNMAEAARNMAEAARGGPGARLGQEIAANLAGQKAAFEARNFEGFVELDELFHAGFAEAIQHPRAWRVIQNEKYQMDRVRFLSIPHSQDVGRLIAQHQAIAEAVMSGDPDAAVAAMKVHLREILRTIQDLATSHAEFFEDESEPPPPSPPPRGILEARS